MIILFNKLSKQIKKKDVEILVFIDNKKRSIGYKRDALVQMAKGKYLAFVDDDDDISDNYIKEMLKGCKSNKDVICFKQLATINDHWSYIDFSVENENEEFNPDNITRRRPFHVCGIKSEIAKKERFKDVGYAEDWDWMERVLQNVVTEYKTNKVLHFYTYDSKVSEAPIESNEVFKNLDLDYEKSNN